MLYPDFNELVNLKAKASSLNMRSNSKVVSPVIGDYKSPFRGQGMEFEEVREYVAGDDVRNIDWRVTARTGSAHVKIFTEERERTVLICVDANDTMRFGTKGTFKSIQAARAAALIGWYANSINDRVGTCVFGNVENDMKFYKPKRSRESLWKMLKLLSDKTPNNNNIVALDETLKHMNKAAPTGSLIFIISDFAKINDSMQKQIGNLRKRCDVVLVSVNDPADMDIAAVGSLLFSDGDNSSLINTDNKKGREIYAQKAMENNDRLMEIAMRFRISVISLATNRDVYNDLRRGLRFT
jgi:uncharacterized protein (DUF58 family)